MRVLVDACVARGAILALRAAGHDVLSVDDVSPPLDDAAVLALAHGEGRVLVTLDKDFGELVIVRDRPHGGIVRLVALPAASQGPACVQVLSAQAEALDRGARVTLYRGRVRVRR